MKAAALLGATIALIAATTLARPSLASASGGTPPVVSSLQRCLQGSHRLIVLNLIDESGSLQQTDPSNERVVGVKAELAGLARLAQTPIDGKPVDVEVRLTSFATGYRALWPEQPNRPQWRKVNARNLPSLLASADTLESRNRGQDTDYVTALQHAQGDLAARSAELTRKGGAPPCQALVWFTDGRYDLVPRVTAATRASGLTVQYATHIPLTSQRAAEQVMSIGRRLLCQNNGLMDQFRQNQVKILTVGLDEGLEPAASRFLRGASVGTTGSRCGRHGRPDSGLYLPASETSQLLFLFSSLFDTPAPVRFCPIPGQSSCIFSTVAGLSSFSLEIATPKSSDKVVLRGPSGAEVELGPAGPHASALSGARITAQWFSPQAVAIEGHLPRLNEAWIGRWRLAFIDPSGQPSGRGTYTLRLRANLYPAIRGNPKATVGRPAEIQLGFVDESGRTVERSPLLRDAALQADLVDLDAGQQTSLAVTEQGTGDWRTTFTPSSRADVVPHLALRLTAVFAPTAGVTLNTAARQIPLTILPPPSYPRIAESDLQLPSVRGLGETMGTVTVLGPTHGTGCVWVTPGRIGLHQQADVARLSVSPFPDAASRCIRIAAGEKKVMTVVAHARVNGSGRATGPLLFHLIGPSGRSLNTPIQVSFDMRPAPDSARAISLFASLLVAGLALPLGLLAFLNWLGARFEPPQLLRYLVCDVKLGSSGELTAPDDEPVDVSPAAFELVANEPKVAARRSFALDGDRFRFVARALGRRGERIPSLLLGPYGVVGTESGVVAAGTPGAPLRSFKRVGRHEVPLSLAGTWIFAPDLHQAAELAGRTDDELDGAGERDSRPIRGRLLLLVPSDSPQEGTRLLLAAADHLGQQASSMLDEVVKRRPADIRRRSLLRRLHAQLRDESDEAETAQSDIDEEELFKTRV